MKNRLSSETKTLALLWLIAAVALTLRYAVDKSDYPLSFWFYSVLTGVIVDSILLALSMLKPDIFSWPRIRFLSPKLQSGVTWSLIFLFNIFVLVFPAYRPDLADYIWREHPRLLDFLTAVFAPGSKL